MFRLLALTFLLNIAPTMAGEVYFQGGALISANNISQINVDKPHCKVDELDLQFPGGQSWKLVSEFPESMSGNSKTHALHITTFWADNDVEITCNSALEPVEFESLKGILGGHLPIQWAHKPNRVSQRPVEEAASTLLQFNRSPALNQQARAHDRQEKIIDIDFGAEAKLPESKKAL